jgi:hypothetical protein
VKKLAVTLSFTAIGVLLVVWVVVTLSVQDGHYSQLDNADDLVVQGSTCVNCHSTAIHAQDPHKFVACTSCHLGDNKSELEDDSHKGMVVIPGNLADVESTCATCHSESVQHILSSLMTSNHGIINVDRHFFGEDTVGVHGVHISSLGDTPADLHLKNLCSSCHLGKEKSEIGEIGTTSRGGGCNACHLNYEKSNDKNTHAMLNLHVSDIHCMGCHSRSGRISTNYMGWHETVLTEMPEDPTKYAHVIDKRVHEFIAEDVHHAAGLQCIDCHGYTDLMGDGRYYAHEEDAVRISCEDCHGEPELAGNSQQRLYQKEIYERLVASYDFKHSLDSVVVTKKDGVPLTNVFSKNGDLVLVSKLSKDEHTVPALDPECSREGVHGALDCNACHAQWVPQCIGCHSELDMNSSGFDLRDGSRTEGTWVEHLGGFFADQPGLGVSTKGGDRVFRPSIPGMIITRTRLEHEEGEGNVFYRLFSLSSPHTTGKSRDCKSCHLNSLALGLGRGSLHYNTENGYGEWIFESEYAHREEDGLPEDAWTGLFIDREDVVSTRSYFRPLNTQEQSSVLLVGACLYCHDQNSDIIRQTLKSDFQQMTQNLPELCILPKTKTP